MKRENNSKLKIIPLGGLEQIGMNITAFEYGMTYEIDKGRLTLRLTAPYSEKRRKKAGEYAKKHGLNHITSRV